MHPLLIAHCTFDDVSDIDLIIGTVNIFAIARTIATVMIAVIEVFIMDGSVAPLDMILPHSHAIALKETHSSSPSYDFQTILRRSNCSRPNVLTATSIN
jgi:hypothetical protein